MEFPNYYAVLPASVRYDGTLRPNAKLLYAEITALCSAKGYCCAKNEYFAQLYGVSRKTISELVGQLAARRYINVEVLRDEKNQVTGRRIWLPESAGEPDAPIPKNRDTSPEKSGDPIPKNREDLIGRIIQERINTPIAPTAMGDIWQGFAGEDAELLQALRDFEQMRKRRKKPMTDRAKKMLLGALTRGSGGRRDIMLQMLEASILHCWDTVYPPKEDDGRPSEKAGKLIEEDWV